MDINEIEGLPEMTTVQVHDLPARPERKTPMPELCLTDQARQAVAEIAPDNLLWRHQSLALERLAQGRNAVVATPTASGKTLIAQLQHLHLHAQNDTHATIVCTPLRALSQDQYASWRNLTRQAGLPKEHTARVDGGTPLPERADLLAAAGAVIMTPDVIHSWLLARQDIPAVTDFLRRAGLLFIDEAHSYNSVFGTNSAYLFRRLIAAIGKRQGKAPAILAATATISEPAEHLRKLASLPFAAVDANDNGAPTHPRRILHLAGSEDPQLAQAVSAVLDLPHRARFIAFTDGRQAVEQIANRVDNPGVVAYRSGYDAKERYRIENQLRAGELQGIIATSAMELGVHIPGLNAGLNLRLPAKRQQFHQRLGRIGRTSPGLFILVAPNNAVSRFGDSIAAYCQAEAEPCHIYLDNPFIKERHRARGANLRQIPGDSVKLVHAADLTYLGDITREQALREAAPHTTYLHQGKQYLAGPWPAENADCPVIKLAPAGGQPPAKSEITRDYYIAKTLDKRIRHPAGQPSYAAEVSLRIEQTAHGYTKELALHTYPPEQRPRTQTLTTGVLLRIKEPWFFWSQSRQQLAAALARHLEYRQSLDQRDTGYAADNLTIFSRKHPQGEKPDDALLVYDRTNGSLRLTAALYDNLNLYAAQIHEAAAAGDLDINPMLTSQFLNWVESLP